MNKKEKQERIISMNGRFHKFVYFDIKGDKKIIKTRFKKNQVPLLYKFYNSLNTSLTFQEFITDFEKKFFRGDYIWVVKQETD